jgi:hypothetical protein
MSASAVRVACGDSLSAALYGSDALEALLIAVGVLLVLTLVITRPQRDPGTPKSQQGSPSALTQAPPP